MCTNNKQLKNYLNYRDIHLNLNKQLIDLIDKTVLLECAYWLDLVEDGNIAIDEEADIERLLDIAIHDYYNADNKNILQIYAESIDCNILSEKKDIIQAKINSKTSLYLVDSVDKKECRIRLSDVFNNYKKTEIIDIGMSQTIQSKKFYIFTRILKFNDFSSTGGISYIFSKSKYKILQKKYIQFLKSLENPKTSTKRSIAFFYLNQLYGKTIVHSE